jgi:hypothetical protein
MVKTPNPIRVAVKITTKPALIPVFSEECGRVRLIDWLPQRKAA